MRPNISSIENLKPHEYTKHKISYMCGGKPFSLIRREYIDQYIHLVTSETINEFGLKRATKLLKALAETPVVICPEHATVASSISATFKVDGVHKAARIIVLKDPQLLTKPEGVSCLLHESIHNSQTRYFLVNHKKRPKNLYLYLTCGVLIQKTQGEKIIYTRGVGTNEGLAEFHALNITGNIFGINMTPSDRRYFDMWNQVNKMHPQEVGLLDDLSWAEPLTEKFLLMRNLGVLRRPLFHNVTNLETLQSFTDINPVYGILDKIYKTHKNRRLNRLERQLSIANERNAQEALNLQRRRPTQPNR